MRDPITPKAPHNSDDFIAKPLFRAVRSRVAKLQVSFPRSTSTGSGELRLNKQNLI